MADEFDPPEHGPLRDNSVIWRLSLWGGAATVAVAAAVLILNADLGLDRVVQALAQPPADQKVAFDDTLIKRAETQRAEENRRIDTRLRELIADRDRLSARLAALEQNFGDLTGSIKRDMAIITATAPKPGTAPSVAPAESAPAPKPETKVETKVEAKPEAKAEAKPDAKTQAAAAETAKPAESQPPQGAGVPMPPTRMAAVPPPATPEEPRKGELGVDLGGARSMDILQARWVAVKANFGPVIEGLRPLAGYDDRPGIIPHRLIVGPLPNAAAAAQICARMHASKVPCRTVEYAGEKMAQ